MLISRIFVFELVKRLIFLESSIELVPKEISTQKSIVLDSKKRGKNPEKIILDDSKHHKAMRSLANREKRGRPDIIHCCLLLFLDSKASKDFEIYIHTINDEIIWVSNKVRLPRNYNRFLGLMEDLFSKKKIVANGETLLEITDLRLKDLTEKRKVFVFKEGEKNLEMLKELDNDSVVCIGAFPHGDFSPKTIKSLGNPIFVSLGKEAYTSLYVTSRFICEYEGVRSAEDR